MNMNRQNIDVLTKTPACCFEARRDCFVRRLVGRYLSATRLVFFVLSLAAPNVMQAAIAYVQQNGTVSHNSAFPVTLVNLSISSAPAVGNTIIVSFVTDRASGTASLTCSDDKGNSYTTDVIKEYSSSPPNYPIAAICSAQIAAGKVPATITLSHHDAYNRVAMVHEYSGLLAAPAVDKTSSGGGNNAAPSSGATAVTTQADELVIGAVSAADGNVSIFNSDGSFPGGPFQLAQSSGSYPRALQTQYRIVSSTGAYTYAPTLTASRRWAAAVATYKGSAAAGINISGTCKQVNETTNCTDTGTIRVAVNGTLQAQTQPTVGGTWTISGVTAPSAGDVITVYIEGATDANEAVAVTRYDGSGNITGIQLIEEHLTIGSDDNQTLSNVDLGQYDYSASGNNEDIFHDVLSGNLTVDTVAAGALPDDELYVLTSNGFTPGGNVTTQHVTIDGTLTAGGNTLTVGGDWDMTIGTFNANSSMVDFTGTGTISNDNASWWEKGFYNVNAAAAGEITTILVGRGIRVSNVLTLDTGTLDGGALNLTKPSGTPLVTAGATLSLSTVKYDSPSGVVNVASTTYTSLWIAGNGPVNNFVLVGDVVCDFLRVYGNGANDHTILDTTTSNHAITCNQLGVGSTTLTNRYGTLKLNGSVVDIGSDVNVYATDGGGANTIDADTATINVSGDWTNNDTFTADTSTVNFDGAALQSITACSSCISGSFSTLQSSNASVAGVSFLDALTTTNFTDTTAASKLTFKAGTTHTVSGTLTLDGSSGNEIVLVSDTPASRFTLDVTSGAQTVSYVNVTDSQSSTNNITASHSTSVSNNDDGEATPHWVFTKTISGTVYTDDDELTAIASETVRLVVNGTDTLQTAITDGSGNYSITYTPTASDIVLVYLDDSGSSRFGTTVTVSNGNSLAGLNIYQDHVVTRHDNAGALSNALLSTADHGDTDIKYTVSTGNLSLIGVSTVLYLPTGHSFTPGGNVAASGLESYGIFNSGTFTIDINGAFIMGGGIFTATSGIWTLAGNLTISGGTFSHNAGTLIMDSTASRTVDIGTAMLNHLTINAGTSTSINITGNVDVDGDLTLTNVSSINTGTMTVSGNVDTTDDIIGGSGIIIFDGVGNETLRSSDGLGGLPAIRIDKSAGMLTIQDTIRLRGNNGLAYIDNGAAGADVDTTTSTIVFYIASMTITPGLMDFYNVEVNGLNFSFSGSTLDVNGNFVITNALNLNGAIDVAGNITVSDNTVSGSAAFTLDGAGPQTIDTGGSGDFPDGNLMINKASGVASLLSNVTLNGFSQDLAVTVGVLDLSGFNLTVPDTLTVGASGTLQLEGGETVSTTTTTLSVGSTVLYDGAGAYAGLAAGDAYSNLSFTGTGSWTLDNALDVNNNLTIVSGTLDVDNIGNYQINVAGDWSNSGTFTARNGTVVLDATGQAIAGSTAFNNLSKDVTSTDTLTFANGTTQTISGTLTLAGRSGNLLNLRSTSPGTQWNLNVSGSSSVNYVDVDDSNATGGNTIYAYYSTDDTVPSNNDNWVFQNLQLVKQVWTEDGTTCLASIPADSNCNGSATSTVVPANTTVYFLIFIRNVMPIAVTDLRFQDLIDDAGFTYQAGSLMRSANDGSAPGDTANLTTLMAAASIAQTDAYDGDTQVDEFAGIDTIASPDDLQVGGAGGAGQNDILSVPANKTLAVKFKAVKI